MCVQDVDVQCVLQFTLLHAAGCALHRHTSRVIHRLELCSEFAIFRSPTSAYNYVVHALSVHRPYIDKEKKTACRGDEREAARSSNLRERSAQRQSERRSPLRPLGSRREPTTADSGTGTPTRTQPGKVVAAQREARTATTRWRSRRRERRLRVVVVVREAGREASQPSR
jgi:hypothetical protein